jgi:hypothetical protein
MFGVCWVQVCWGGSGSYVGGISRTTRYWWNGRDWQDRPVDRGPFETKTEAEAFAKTQTKSYFVYEENDPFGEKPQNEEI